MVSEAPSVKSADDITRPKSAPNRMYWLFNEDMRFSHASDATSLLRPLPNDFQVNLQTVNSSDGS